MKDINKRDLKMHDSELLLIGTGLVGSSLLAALCETPISITVLEKSLPEEKTTAVADDRPLSLSYGSVQILKNLGIWNVLAEQACPIQRVHVSEQGRFGNLQFVAQDYDVDALGYVVPFQALQQALFKRACENTHVNFIKIEKLVEINANESQAKVIFTANNKTKQCTAKLIIAADGSASPSRKMMGIKTKIKNPHEQAMIFDLHLASRQQGVAFERFTKQGALALLPLWDAKHYRLVWTATNVQAKTAKTWSEAALIAFINDVFNGYTPIVNHVKVLSSFPLQTVIAKEQSVPGFLLIGNAAHTIYPLAAQGFNLGLCDVAALAQVLQEAHQQNKSIDTTVVLEKYLIWRKDDQQKIICLTHHIAQLFGLQMPLLGDIRGLGLFGTQLLMPIKHRLAKQLMGLANPLPNLVRRKIR